MPFRFLIATALVAFLGIAPAFALTINIRGGGSCEEWTEARTKGSDTFDRAWLLGYLSGMATATKTFDFWGERPASYFENDKAYRWIDTYCRDNPRDRVTTAAAELFQSRQSEVLNK